MKKSIGKFGLAAFLLLSAAFGFNAAAQNDSGKPMSAKPLTDLIVEFKEIVSKNARNQNDTKLIGARWDKRKDSESYLDAKIETAFAKHEKEIFALLDTANLNKIINQFVAENYKK